MNNTERRNLLHDLIDEFSIIIRDFDANQKISTYNESDILNLSGLLAMKTIEILERNESKNQHP